MKIPSVHITKDKKKKNKKKCNTLKYNSYNKV